MNSARFFRALATILGLTQKRKKFIQKEVFRGTMSLQTALCKQALRQSPLLLLRRYPDWLSQHRVLSVSAGTPRRFPGLPYQQRWYHR